MSDMCQMTWGERHGINTVTVGDLWIIEILRKDDEFHYLE